MSNQPAPEDIPWVAPAGETRQPAHPTCPHCRSTDIVKGVKLNQSNEVGSIGLAYEGPSLLGVLKVGGTEPLLADLCKHCGTVLRLFVRHVDRKWA